MNSHLVAVVGCATGSSRSFRPRAPSITNGSFLYLIYQKNMSSITDGGLSRRRRRG
jgi:hypothetical protein